MKHFLTIGLTTALLLSFSFYYSYAQSDQSLFIQHQGHVFRFTPAYLTTHAKTQVTASDHEHVIHNYEGIPLEFLLKKAGTPLNKKLRGEQLSKYLLVTARDGYKVIFALPELDSSFNQRKIILAVKKDGRNLGQQEGPYQIIVEGEKKHARYIRMVEKLEIKNAD